MHILCSLLFIIAFCNSFAHGSSYSLVVSAVTVVEESSISSTIEKYITWKLYRCFPILYYYSFDIFVNQVSSLSDNRMKVYFEIQTSMHSSISSESAYAYISEKITSCLGDVDQTTVYNEASMNSGTRPELAHTLSFLILADWGKSSTYGSRRLGGHESKGDKGGGGKGGGGTSYYQTAVAKAMGSYVANANSENSEVSAPTFIVALGDNFYNNGVRSTSDSLWTYLWENVYHGSYESLKLPWYPVLGNHDYGYGSTGVNAQIAMTDMYVELFYSLIYNYHVS